MHLPGPPRDEFLHLLDGNPVDSPTARVIVGRLWTCTDVLPRDYCDTLDLPQGSTYAAAAHALRTTWGPRR